MINHGRAEAGPYLSGLNEEGQSVGAIEDYHNLATSSGSMLPAFS
jgi:hypothetical protein